MHHLARAQHRYDRQLPADLPADLGSGGSARAGLDPLQRLRDDIAADPHADADISTAFVERMYGACDRNVVMFLLLAGTPEGDARALRHLKAALLAVAQERMACH